MRRGPLTAGEKVQFTDRRSNKITDQLVPGGVTQTSHGIILHDDVIGQSEGSVVVTVSAKREAQINQDHPERDANKPWKGTRAIGGWQFAVMRPRLADYVLSMPRGAQIMYPKDIAQVIQLGDFSAHQHLVFPNKDWSFHKHPVCCKKRKLLFLTHLRKFIFQFHLFINISTGIEETLQRKTAFFPPGFQFLCSWIVRLNITQRIFCATLIQPFLSLFAGTAFWIAYK